MTFPAWTRSLAQIASALSGQFVASTNGTAAGLSTTNLVAAGGLVSTGNINIAAGSSVVWPAGSLGQNNGTIASTIPFKLPAYPTASLPVLTAGAVGALAFDTTRNQATVWTGTAWV